jgi:tetraacyldisaccharide 4'-kinase
MELAGDLAVNLLTGLQKPVKDFAGQQCRAVAGIGNPERFLKQLQGFGLDCEMESFPDHYEYQPGDVSFSDNKPVFMTEKDAVKCKDFATDNHWYVPVFARLDTAFTTCLLSLIKRIP